MRGAFVIAAALVAFPAAAQDAPGRSQDQAWHNRQFAALSALDQADGWRPLERGVMWRRVKGDGSGQHPDVNDRVRIHYAGRLIDGTQFDSSWDRGEPATFPLGRLIPGWQIAVPQMGVGDTIEIAVPPDAGYGPLGKGPIPGGAVLLFTIELFAVNPAQ